MASKAKGRLHIFMKIPFTVLKKNQLQTFDIAKDTVKLCSAVCPAPWSTNVLMNWVNVCAAQLCLQAA